MLQIDLDLTDKFIKLGKKNDIVKNNNNKHNLVKVLRKKDNPVYYRELHKYLSQG